VAYVAAGALHVTEVSAGQSDCGAPGARRRSYGLAEHVAAESCSVQRLLVGSDGQRLLAARVDNCPVQRWGSRDPADPERPPSASGTRWSGTANAEYAPCTCCDLRQAGRGHWDQRAYEYLTAVRVGL